MATTVKRCRCSAHTFFSVQESCRESRWDFWPDSWREFSRSPSVSPESRIGLYAWLSARLSPRLVFFTRDSNFIINCNNQGKVVAQIYRSIESNKQFLYSVYKTNIQLIQNNKKINYLILMIKLNIIWVYKHKYRIRTKKSNRSWSLKKCATSLDIRNRRLLTKIYTMWASQYHV